MNSTRAIIIVALAVCIFTASLATYIYKQRHPSEPDRPASDDISEVDMTLTRTQNPNDTTVYSEERTKDSTDIQNIRINFKVKDAPLDTVFDRLEKKYPKRIVTWFAQRSQANTLNYTVNCKKGTLTEILDSLFLKHQIRYQIIDFHSVVVPLE